jgi:hypothetical protein
MRNQIRAAIIASLSLGMILTLAASANAASYCARTRLCADPADGVIDDGYYVGHDEPALFFYSSTAGSGNSSYYIVTLPTEPSAPAAAGGVNSFELYTAFWFGMALCDSQSAPEYTNAECTPDSDSNIFDNSDPTAPDYAGHRFGGAYMELQFYPPASPGQNPPSCDPNKWCAALNIDSFSADQTGPTEIFNNSDCIGQFGDEPVNIAWVTRSGNATASNALVNLSLPEAPVTSDVLLMNPGDQLAIAVSDTPSGLHVSITDFTTGQQGSMTANGTHGFEQEVYAPNATSCTTQPYTFHPMFATSSAQTRVWTAHTYNVAFSMEIGHQTQDGYTNNGDSSFTGPSYVHDWPGSLPPATDSTVHASSVAFPSPIFLPTHGHASGQYDQVAFEADMPVFEFDDPQGCVTATGMNCTNPPQGAAFYPIYSTASAGFLNLSCVWHFGDTQIANTNNLFGGDSVAEYGPLLDTFFPGLGFRFENYHNTVSNNPCEYVSITTPPFPKFPRPLPPNVRTRPQPIPPEELLGIEMIIAEEETLRIEGMSEGQVLRVGEVLETIDDTILGSQIGASGGGS